MPLLSEKKLNRELKEIEGLRFEDDRFDNMPFSMLDYPAFKDYLNKRLAHEGCHLEQPPEKGTKAYRIWDSGIGFNAFDLQRHTASVDEHTDDVLRGRYFGLYVVDTQRSITSRRGRYFDTRSEFRHINQFGGRERTRLSKGDLLVFNPRLKHELIYFGNLTTVALFDVKKTKQ